MRTFSDEKKHTKQIPLEKPPWYDTQGHILTYENILWWERKESFLAKEVSRIASSYPHVPHTLAFNRLEINMRWSEGHLKIENISDLDVQTAKCQTHCIERGFGFFQILGIVTHWLSVYED